MDAKQIAGYAKKAGFKSQDLVTAVAVALAESSGNPNAHNANAATKDNSYGLWQINMYGALGPARRKQFNLKKNEELFNPATNARVAYALYKARGGFADWSVYKNNSYKKELNKASIAVSGTDWENQTDFGGEDFKEEPSLLDGAISGIGGAAGSINIASAIRSGINSLTESIFKIGLNTGITVFAIVLMILGVIILLRAPLQRAAETVGKVT